MLLKILRTKSPHLLVYFGDQMIIVEDGFFRELDRIICVLFCLNPADSMQK